MMQGRRGQMNEQQMRQMMQQMGQRQQQMGLRQRQPGQRRGQRAQAGQEEQEQAPPAGNQRQVRWLIAVEGDVPLKVIASSQRGGTDVEELTIR